MGSLSRENIGRHTWAVVLKFFAERTYFTKSQMSTKKQLNIIVNINKGTEFYFLKSISDSKFSTLD